MLKTVQRKAKTGNTNIAPDIQCTTLMWHQNQYNTNTHTHTHTHTHTDTHNAVIFMIPLLLGELCILLPITTCLWFAWKQEQSYLAKLFFTTNLIY